MKKDDRGCLIYYLIIFAIDVIGVILVRTNSSIKEIVAAFYIPLFFFVFIASLVLSGFNWKPKDFFSDVAGISRWYLIAFMPIFLASIFK